MEDDGYYHFYISDSGTFIRVRQPEETGEIIIYCVNDKCNHKLFLRTPYGWSGNAEIRGQLCCKPCIIKMLNILLWWKR